MKNLLLSIFFVLATYSIASAQYFFGAQVSSLDSCCITIKAGVQSSSLDSTWHVVVDGLTTYNSNSPEYVGNDILHCFDGNGSHTVNFYVNGVLYWSRVVEITDCEGDCSVCEIPSMILDGDIIDTCGHQVWLDVRFPNINGQIGYSDTCTNPVYTWDYGDGSPVANTGSQSYVFYNYAQPGTYTACVTLSLTNPNGGTCVTTECVEVVVPECDTVAPEPCCGFALGDLGYMIAPWDPCMVRIAPSSIAYKGECANHTLSWDIDGDGIVDGTGAAFITTFTTPGPHTVCLTMAYGNCSITKCGVINLPDCNDGGGKPGDVKEMSSNTAQLWDKALEKMNTATTLELFPNPVINELNLKISADISRIQLVDITGKIVKEAQVNNTTQTAIDVRQLASGVYFVKAMNNNGELKTTERFVKIR